MIRAARRRHVVTWALGALVIGVGFAAALAVSRPGAATGRSIASYEDDGQERTSIASRDVTVDGRRYVVRLLARDVGAPQLGVSQWDGPVAPDQLVYWSDAPDPDTLDGCTLLGALTRLGSVFDLPTGADTSTGAVVVYSLAHQEMIVSTSLEEDAR